MMRFGVVGQASRLSRIAKHILTYRRLGGTSYDAVPIDGLQLFETGGTPVLPNCHGLGKVQFEHEGLPRFLEGGEVVATQNLLE